MSLSVAIVTGGSRGIGRACALRLAREGYAVAVNYRNDAAAAENVVMAIEATGGRAVAVKGDVANEEDVRGLFAIVDTMGTLKVLVNNAGIMDAATRVESLSAERLARMLAVNVMGSVLCAREAVKRMSLRHGGTGGAIVNISSAATVHGAPGQFVDYALSKGAIDTFTIGLGREVAGEGIRVNAIRPGLIDTEIHASAGEPDRLEKLRGSVPMGREGRPEEVAAMASWLASEDASYATGAIFTVAGGRV
jgi:NAD(P)-dependent dehydrogenase (short-subunit alcohol dehydrogenase family)